MYQTGSYSGNAQTGVTFPILEYLRYSLQKWTERLQVMYDPTLSVGGAR